MAKGDGSKLWSMFSLAAALGGAAAARKAIDKSWQISTGKKPPENPADPDVDIWEAVAWAATTGAAVALAKMYAQRRAAGYYVKSTGTLPPPLRKDGQ
ncbi:DUF4235 domain-containing protein [Nocardioides immobilis]|uniref:DUF4235 domain-containing protein n=1 Tax=Nocardioides immobilis TaxID=2049295 RepID=A0A417XXX2_9ACTN|nr:DUF4235 domain-containing protein [Nocardioides immobilis]RHW25100.1 DUF4235 domain-containing protein [Nocardioides immobilis]